MIKIIHISKENIDHNSRNPTELKIPVIQVNDGTGDVFGNEAIIYGQDGKEAARIIYSPNNPLPTGALVWIKTSGRVELI